ncbi:MAG: hypothetical protein BAA02_01415 [Paenibacillaceae bacterium ZCTH02-B3]|nr:MAG: hypothetical protein BAA02_01415 [Paenibacillaceae bacterium ZCTH02-B3]
MKKIRLLFITVLVFALLSGPFAGSAYGASDRYATVEEVAGTVTVKKAGGALGIRVYPGMALREGDWISTGPNGYLLLRTERGDEIMIGENWRGTLSRLRDNGRGGTDTAVSTWAGPMYNHVRKTADTGSTYRVETPTEVLGARGTHFLVSINPYTGEVKLIVNAGIVDAGDEPIFPSQQGTIFPWMDNWTDTDVADPDEITISFPEDVLIKLMINKGMIDEENRELMEAIAEMGIEAALERIDDYFFEKLKTNAEALLTHMLRTAMENGTLDPTVVKRIIDEANYLIKEENRKYNLESEVPPLDRTAGADPEEEERRRQQREQAEEQRKERNQAKEDKREALKQQDQDILDKLEQRKKEQEEANRQAEEEKENQALEQYRDQLSEEERQELEEKIKKRKEEKEQMDRSGRQQETTDPAEEPAPPAPPAPSAPSAPPGPAVTAMTLDLSVTDVVYGQPFTITADISAPGPQPDPNAGTVEFRIGSVILGTGTVTGGTATLFVDDKALASLADEIGYGRHTLSAAYSGVPQQYAGSTVRKEILFLPSSPVLLVWKEPVDDAPNSFEVRFELANFAGSNAIFGADVRFLHHLSLGDWETDPEFVDTLEANEAKFGDDPAYSHNFGHIEYPLPGGGQGWIARYEFEADNDAGAEFAERDYIAKIRFDLMAWSGKTPDDVAIDVVFVQFYGKDGPIDDIFVLAGPGVTVNLSE